jgi:hypothetical protein
VIRLDNLEAFDRLGARFARLQNPDARGLMLTWQTIIKEDNRRGVLAGLDKDGQPLIPVTYRPKGTPEKPTKSQRYGQRANIRYGRFLPGFLLASYGNLTTREYQKLGGPPLAPRGQFSRVITNLLEGHAGPIGPTQWAAECYWDQVVSRQGVPFLGFHFRGEPLGRGGPSKRRDLRGIRPEGIAKAREVAVNWMRDMVRSGGV